MPKYSRFSSVLTLGTSWLRFYPRFIRLYMLFSCIGLFMNVLQLIISTMYTMYSILSFAYYGSFLWLCMKAYNGVIDLTERGYTFNLVFLWFLAFGPILFQLIRGQFTISVALGEIPGAVIPLMPLVYFRKRRYLFSGNAGRRNKATVRS